MKKDLCLSSVLAVVVLVLTVAGCLTIGDEAGFKPLFNGVDFKGWRIEGGAAEFAVENGEIVGRGVLNEPGNTFLCTEREYGNFILKLEFKLESGNSGVQVRSAVRPQKANRRGTEVFGYQGEITVDGTDAGRIYDEGRRGYRHDYVWLDLSTPQERLDAAKAAYRPGEWNEMEIQCVGSSGCRSIASSSASRTGVTSAFASSPTVPRGSRSSSVTRTGRASFRTPTTSFPTAGASRRTAARFV